MIWPVATANHRSQGAVPAAAGDHAFEFDPDF